MLIIQTPTQNLLSQIFNTGILNKYPLTLNYMNMYNSEIESPKKLSLSIICTCPMTPIYKAQSP